MPDLRATGSATPPWCWIAAAGVLVAGGGWIAVTGASALGLLVLLATAGSIVVAPRSGPLALGILVASVMLQIAVGAQLNPAQALAGATFYLVGRLGSRWSVPSAVGVILVMGVLEAVAAVLLGSELVEQLLYRSRIPAGAALLTVVVAAAAVLVVPLLVGVAEHARAAAREGAAARERAERELDGTRVLMAVEAERARLARDVHDTVGHALTVVITQTRVLAAVAGRDPAAVLHAAAAVEQVASAALDDVRGVLAGAVQTADVTVDDLVQLAGSTDRVQVHVEGDVVLLRGEAGEAAYRAVQELVTNALRHGDGARPVTVSISALTERVEILVRNAIPSERGARSSEVDGSGLVGLRARLEAVGGVLESVEQDGAWRAWASLPIAGPS